MHPEELGKFADAASELAKTTDHALTVTEKFGAFFKAPLMTVARILDNELFYIGSRRAMRLSEKWDRLLQERGLERLRRPLPLNFSVPLLTTAVLEEDEELQDMWARLLINAADMSTDMELRTAYVEILKGMSAFDVRNLYHMARASLESSETRFLPVIETWHLPKFARLRQPEDRGEGEVSEEVGISLANLSRLGCAAPAYGLGGMALYNLMTVTHLGRAIYRACS